MPREETLEKMYGPQYRGAFADAPTIDDPKEFDRVIAWLGTRPPGTFVDYGCGAGELLAEARRIGWHSVGVEFDPAVAAEAQRRVQVPIVDRFTVNQFDEPFADVLHLGDVIEHLTDPDTEMPRVLRLIKPGGILIAQGPLEANTNVFTSALKIWKRARRYPMSEMAPYHVMLATARGQETFFRRFGLEPREFSIREVSWPAPTRLGVSDLVRPRALALFTLRRMSQLCSALRPDVWGNRYFYIGRWPGDMGVATSATGGLPDVRNLRRGAV